MKNLIILLSFLSIFSCKKAQKNISNQKVLNETTINKNLIGDAIVSDLNFAKSINSSCKLNTTFFNRSDKQIKEDNAECALSKIKFDYDKLNSINKKIDMGNISPEIKLFIKNSSSIKTDNADLAYEVTLFIEKDKTISDSIIIYQSFNYSEALTVKTKYFYLDKDDIYLLDVIEDESGGSAEKWAHHKINATGKITLLRQRQFSNENNNVTAKMNDDIWKGTYYFEASNRNEVKTTFDITINSLEDLSVNVTEEGVKNKYFHLKAEEMGNKKIKITYDKSSDDMGTIYIEKLDNEYFISGNPIYFINPGNNDMPLKKVK